MEKFKLTLPASMHFTGDIMVTDPCYFIPKDIWSELMKAWFPTNEGNEYSNEGIIEFKNGAKVLYTGTAYGDGDYPLYVERGNGESVHRDHVGVDAGMISVISVEDLKKLNPRFNVDDEWYPRVNDFDGVVKADGNGSFIGDLEVNTREEEPEVDEYEYDEDEDIDPFDENED